MLSSAIEKIPELACLESEAFGAWQFVFPRAVDLQGDSILFDF
jgi:hypothetical protein